jgi:hypothetical protein
MFPVYGGNCLSCKAVYNWLRNSLTDFQKSQMMPDLVWKWLRQQSKEFCAASFDPLEKQWDKCINICGGYIEK